MQTVAYSTNQCYIEIKLGYPTNQRKVKRMGQLGLAFITKEFGVQIKTVAEELGISPEAVHSWLSGKRKIPSKRLEQLSEIFKLDPRYFQKELEPHEELEIQRLHLMQLSAKESYEEEYEEVDENGNIFTKTHVVNPHVGEIDQVVHQKQVELVLNQIRHLIDGSIDPIEAPQNNLMIQELVELLSDGKQRDRNLKALQLMVYLLKYKDSDLGIRPEYLWCVAKEGQLKELEHLVNEK
ncbi:helix-turn-helix domain-containing protein [Alicyclobacillus dauci]|uniref:Helix-turn-helix domain-containing protein n=1 Tax=Alicyclobacillus dauci TaxID=1475485 RepID=A0ABY6Z2X9_9BACL|nr:helix-turn-helix transcriptional regulator [Alicyclobacillus dauci]WAH37027.1 helix-turn-helix domain-containing protein [Alicyclobacillus dauci]